MSNDLEKGWKDKFLAAGLATGLATSAMAAPAQQHEAPKAQPQEQSIVFDPSTLHPELVPIAHLESSFGKNMHHARNSKGDFHTALGAVAIKPVTAFETYLKSPHLQKLFPNANKPDTFLGELKKNPQFYNAVTGSHWDRMKKAVGGSIEKAAFAWRWGIGAAHKAMDSMVQKDPYVSSYKKWPVGGTTAQMTAPKMSTPKTTMPKTSMPTMHEPLAINKYEALVAIVEELKKRESNHMEFVHYSPIANLKELDPTFQGTGPIRGRERARPDRIPRVYVYEKGSNSESLVSTRSYKYQVKVPPGTRIYDMSKDPLRLLSSQLEKTESGIFFKPADLNDAEKSIIANGYSGYRNYSSNYPNAVVLFLKVPVKRV